MPCIELFEEQSQTYKDEVLPPSVRKRIVVEVEGSFSFDRIVCLLYKPFESLRILEKS